MEPCSPCSRHRPCPSRSGPALQPPLAPQHSSEHSPTEPARAQETVPRQREPPQGPALEFPAERKKGLNLPCCRRHRQHGHGRARSCRAEPARPGPAHLHRAGESPPREQQPLCCTGHGHSTETCSKSNTLFLLCPLFSALSTTVRTKHTSGKTQQCCKHRSRWKRNVQTLYLLLNPFPARAAASFWGTYHISHQQTLQIHCPHFSRHLERSSDSFPLLK